MITRHKRGALGVLGALLAAAGLLVGLGSRAEAPAGGDPGAAAAERTTEVGATAPDSAARRASVASSALVEPDRLRIPSLGIDAPVVPIAADGLRLIPPSDPRSVGWWSAGAHPGAERGTAILTGHTVSTGGGVFDDLERVRPGQRVQVLSSGTRLSLRVTSVTNYSKTALAKHAGEIFDQTSTGRVALVTCADWTGVDYQSNIVVIATPVS